MIKHGATMALENLFDGEPFVAVHWRFEETKCRFNTNHAARFFYGFPAQECIPLMSFAFNNLHASGYARLTGPEPYIRFFLEYERVGWFHNVQGCWLALA
jgi:hypothetical protein